MGVITAQPPLPVAGVRLSLWRAVCVFRVAGLVVCLFLIVLWRSIYQRPDVALLAGAGMLIVTAVLVRLGLRGYAHRKIVVLADLVATSGLTLLSIPAQTAAQQHGGMVTLTTIWAAGPTIEAAFVMAPLGGVVVAVVQYAVAAGIAEQWQGRTLYSGVLLIVLGAVVAAVATFAARAEEDVRGAEAARAAVAERERLARSIHDGVLQVLALVHRAGAHADGDWPELAAAAAEQEAALRGLLATRAAPVPRTGRRDLAADLRALGAPGVTVAVPAEAVFLDAHPAGELVDAVRAALHNVALHAGAEAQAWILLDALDDELHVLVRDDGVGIAPGHLETARSEGRFGVAHSIRGRLDAIGGTCTITSAPGSGTEIEMVVPR